jgi:hypothetical protein
MEGAGKSSEAYAPDTIGIADFSRGQFSKTEFKRLHPHGQRCLLGWVIRQPVKRELCGCKKKAPPVVRAAHYWKDLPTPSR